MRTIICGYFHEIVYAFYGLEKPCKIRSMKSIVSGDPALHLSELSFFSDQMPTANEATALSTNHMPEFQSPSPHQAPPARTGSSLSP